MNVFEIVGLVGAVVWLSPALAALGMLGLHLVRGERHAPRDPAQECRDELAAVVNLDKWRRRGIQAVPQRPPVNRGPKGAA